MNAELKDKITKIILKNPDALEMHESVNECGTACCIAGWACVLSGKFKSPMEFAEKRRTDGLYWQRVHCTAMDLLQITDWEARRLFHVSNWPTRLRLRYWRGDKSAAVDMMNLIHEESAA